MDPRHEKRIKIVQELFSLFFNKRITSVYNKRTLEIVRNEKKIDSLIKKYAQKFPLDKIAKVDRAILKLAIYELTVERSEPSKVIIDEAVELAKEMGSERSYSFINAVLGKVYNQLKSVESVKSVK